MSAFKTNFEKAFFLFEGNYYPTRVIFSEDLGVTDQEFHQIFSNLGEFESHLEERYLLSKQEYETAHSKWKKIYYPETTNIEGLERAREEALKELEEDSLEDNNLLISQEWVGDFALKPLHPFEKLAKDFEGEFGESLKNVFKNAPIMPLTPLSESEEVLKLGNYVEVRGVSNSQPYWILP